MKMERTIGGNRNRGCYFSLACSIGSFSIACGSLLSINAYNEKISLQRGIFLTSLGFIYFISLTDFFNKYFLETSSGQRFRQKYRLMMSDVLDITNKTVSTIQAALSCIAGFIVCNSSCRKSFLTASHFMSDAYAWFGTAYFIYDIWAMYKVHVQKISDKLKLTKAPSNINNNNNNHLSNNNNNSTAIYSKLNVLSQNGNGKLIQKKIQQNGNPIEKSTNNNNGIDTVNDRGDGKQQSIVDTMISSMNDETTTNGGQKLKYKKMNNTKIQNNSLMGGGGGGNNNGKGIEEKITFLKYCITHPIMIIHHLFLGSFGLLVIVYLRGAFGDCVYGFIYLMEFSTPYVSIRSILSTMGLKKSRIYIVNGLIMLGTFFVCRILMWPFVYYWYSQLTNMSVLQAIASLPSCCKIGTLILFLPQIYWFYLMLRGAIKVFFPPKSTSISTGKNKNHSNHHNNNNNNNKKTDKTKITTTIDRINNNNNNNNTINSKNTNSNKTKNRKDIQNRNLK